MPIQQNNRRYKKEIKLYYIHLSAKNLKSLKYNKQKIKFKFF